MRFLNFSTRWMIIALALTIGCNSKPTSSTSDSAEEGGSVATGPNGQNTAKKLVPAKKNVKTIEGNWAIVITRQRADNYRWIIKLSRGEQGKFTAEFLDSSQDKDDEKPRITSTEVDGDAIRIDFENDFGKFDFVGAFQQGFIRGTIRKSPSELYLTRMLPTDEKSLERYGATGLPPGADVYEGITKNKEATPETMLRDLVAAAKDLKYSPLTQDMYAMLLMAFQQANVEEAKLKDLIESYLSAATIWGERWEARVELSIAAGLANGRRFPRWALEHIEVAEKKIGEDREVYAETFQALRDSANTSIDIEELSSTSSTDEVKSVANARLTELLKKQTFNPEILFALATYAEKTGQIDTAIGYLSEVVVLPMLEASILRLRAGQPPDSPKPSELFNKLWVQKHGNEAEIAKFLDDVYRKKIDAYLAEIQSNGPAIPEGESGNKVVLVELFTGMQCPPCIGADFGLSALSKSFPTSKLIVLRFHQHIPGPDGLVNQDSEERSVYYDARSTPTITMDGAVLDPKYYAGPIFVAPNAYGVFRALLDPRLAQKTEVSIALSAVVANGELKISAEATGVPDDILPTCRLRLAIAENLVRTIAPFGTNGIRDHELLVREMPGLAKGIPPKKGVLKYEETMPATDIQKHLDEYIKRFEAGRRTEFPAEMKPPIMGPLSLVAWVQSDKVDEKSKSMPVLQAALVPISGDIPFGSSASTPTAAEKTPSESPEKKPEDSAVQPPETPK